MGARNVPGASGRPDGRQLGGQGDSSDEIERYRTVAIAISSAAVTCAAVIWALNYYQLMGPR